MFSIPTLWGSPSSQSFLTLSSTVLCTVPTFLLVTDLAPQVLINDFHPASPILLITHLCYPSSRKKSLTNSYTCHIPSHMWEHSVVKLLMISEALCPSISPSHVWVCEVQQTVNTVFTWCYIITLVVVILFLLSSVTSAPWILITHSFAFALIICWMTRCHFYQHHLCHPAGCCCIFPCANQRLSS